MLGTVCCLSNNVAVAHDLIEHFNEIMFWTRPQVHAAAVDLRFPSLCPGPFKTSQHRERLAYRCMSHTLAFQQPVRQHRRGGWGSAENILHTQSMVSNMLQDAVHALAQSVAVMLQRSVHLKRTDSMSS